MYKFLFATLIFYSALFAMGNLPLYRQHRREFREWDELSKYSPVIAGRDRRFREWDYLSLHPPRNISPPLFMVYHNELKEWDSLYLSIGEEVRELFAFWDSLSSQTDECEGVLSKLIESELLAERVERRRRNRDINLVTMSRKNPAAPAERTDISGYTDLLLNIDLNLYSNRLALTPYREIFELDDPDIRSRFITETLRNTFNINSSNPKDNRKRIERGLRGDVRLVSTFKYEPINVSGESGSFGVFTRYDLAVHVPKDILGVAFTGALQPGAELDISDLAVYASAISGVRVGKRSRLDDVSPIISKLTGDEAKSVWRGVEATILMGHSYLSAEGKRGDIVLDSLSTSFTLDGLMRVRTAGAGAKGFYEFDDPLRAGLTPSGYGLSLDMGMQSVGGSRIVSFSLFNIGAIRWSDARESYLTIKGESLDLEGLIHGGGERDYWSSEEGGYLSDRSDTLSEISDFWRPSPLSLQVGVVQLLHATPYSLLSLVSDQVRVTAEYTQGLINVEGNTLVPRVRLGFENDMLGGFIRSGYSFIGGGSERLASTAQLRLFDRSFFSVRAEYIAYGSPILFPKRGVGASLNMGFTPLRDR